MAFAKLVSGLVCLVSVSTLVVVGCGGGGDTLPDLGALGDGGGFDPNNPGGNDKICLLNNCDTDRHCQDCSGGRTTCNQKENRCVACGPEAGGKTCGAGQTCTKYGDCVGGGAACAEDANNVPTIACNSDADCAACGPDFKVCDVGSKKCVGCTPANITNCQSTDVCKNNTCQAACPATCTVDADCFQCGGTNGAPANNACNRGICAKCSESKRCPSPSEICNDVGDCEKACGLATNPNRCNTDADCSGCMGGLTKCTNKPIAGGTGTCAVAAAGCSDLGMGTFVLPDPFSRVTQACSTDSDCAGIKASLNVGGLIKKATGLGVGDGSLDYPMNACASVDILDGKKCGVCVPCRTDLDCQPADVTKFAGEAFGPIGSIAAALLLDKVFGPSDRKVHMYCQQITRGYGACVPCPSFFQRCGDAAFVDDTPATACGHDVCVLGPGLGPTCNEGCAGRVAQVDPFCGSQMGFWDQKCKTLVETECKNKTCFPNSCNAPKEAGWYCNDTNKVAGYRCGGDGVVAIAEGSTCPATPNPTYCHRVDPTDIRSKAIVDGTGKPRCFPSPQ
jgi:hypothetical protein